MILVLFCLHTKSPKCRNNDYSKPQHRTGEIAQVGTR